MVIFFLKTNRFTGTLNTSVHAYL